MPLSAPRTIFAGRARAHGGGDGGARAGGGSADLSMTVGLPPSTARPRPTACHVTSTGGMAGNVASVHTAWAVVPSAPAMAVTVRAVLGPTAATGSSSVETAPYSAAASGSARTSRPAASTEPGLASDASGDDSLSDDSFSSAAAGDSGRGRGRVMLSCGSAA